MFVLKYNTSGLIKFNYPVASSNYQHKICMVATSIVAACCLEMLNVID